ncbi:hypothetical protein [Fuerstiella marisgermanici]|uniref:Uncharacterized protein n=1 Tax=Fuerstiella marisgermanici TaxID=1891926 RepID=A0A1P8WP74_9PLAN|nr:hypothetical protein [Fuerstiella marisgermanici]APZ95864.1 hypothetical protein Fuma_05527 [Fuerstiella marisgermanici]
MNDQTKLTGHLELQHESSGLRHYLDGQPVHAGSLIEVFTESTGWTPARYEWSFLESRPATAWISDEEIVDLDPDMPVRWPRPAIE